MPPNMKLMSMIQTYLSSIYHSIIAIHSESWNWTKEFIWSRHSRIKTKIFGFNFLIFCVNSSDILLRCCLSLTVSMMNGLQVLVWSLGLEEPPTSLIVIPFISNCWAPVQMNTLGRRTQWHHILVVGLMTLILYWVYLIGCSKFVFNSM